MNQNQDNTLSFSNQSSIEINKTSTGKVSYSCKAYGNFPEEIEQRLRELIDIAKAKAKSIEG